MDDTHAPSDVNCIALCGLGGDQSARGRMIRLIIGAVCDTADLVSSQTSVLPVGVTDESPYE